MKKIRNNESAITLIALVVTIVILLILAGVSIQMVNQFNLINKAKEAGNIYEGSSQNETNSIEELAKTIDNYDDNYDKQPPVIDFTIQPKAIKGQILSADVSISDSGTGIDSSNEKWIMNQSSENIGTNLEDYTSTVTDNKISIDTQNVGDFYIHILAKDKNSNAAEKISNKLTIIDPIVTEFSYTGNIQTFTSTEKGTYKIEAYGAQGGGNLGGKGGYSYGNYQMNANDKLYICVGSQGISGMDIYVNYAGGYNGGGIGGQGHVSKVATIIGPAGAGGGGATSITSTNRVTLSNFSSYRNEVFLVGGGGGGYGWNGAIPGGTGGGTTGGEGATTKYIYPNNNYLGVISTGGTQTSGYAFGIGQNGRNGSTASCGAEGGGGAGGGWYGGTCSQIQGDWTNSGGGGGSGYVNPTLTLTGNEGGNNSGNGKARITLISI